MPGAAQTTERGPVQPANRRRVEIDQRAAVEVSGGRSSLEIRFAGVADDGGAGGVAEADKFVPV